MPVDQAGELGGGLIVHVETAGEFIAKYIKWCRDTPVGPDEQALVHCLMIESIPAEFGSEVTAKPPMFATTYVSNMKPSGTSLEGTNGERRLTKKKTEGPDEITTEENIIITLDSQGGLIRTSVLPGLTIEAQLLHCVLTGKPSTLAQLTPLSEGEIISIMLWGSIDEVVR
jgi:hypothetical protein